MTSQIRELTLLVDVEQPTANWLWESHIQWKGLNGVLVKKIGEGNQMIEIEGVGICDQCECAKCQKW